MLVLGLDFETTGLEPGKDQVIEVGAVLWDTELRTPVRMLNELCSREGEDAPEVSEFITGLTGITQQMLKAHGEVNTYVFKQITLMLNGVDYLVAHNAPFDRAFLEADGKIAGFEFEGYKWIDTRTDLPREAYTKGKSASLGYMAADHGFINPFPHRAVTDVLTMLKLMSLYPMDEIIKRQESITIDVVANVSFAAKDKAKNAGFHWDGTRKVWHRQIKECDFDELSQEWDFPVKK